MPAERIARRSVAFFLIKSSVNFVAVAVLGTLMAAGLVGPELSLLLTALPAALSVAVIALVLAIPRAGPGRDPRPDASRLVRGVAAARRAVITGSAEAVEILRSRDLAVMAGMVGGLGLRRRGSLGHLRGRRGRRPDLDRDDGLPDRPTRWPASSAWRRGGHRRRVDRHADRLRGAGRADRGGRLALPRHPVLAAPDRAPARSPSPSCAAPSTGPSDPDLCQPIPAT